jgi:hypothetical protein
MSERALGPEPACPERMKLAGHVDGSGRLLRRVGSLRRCSASPLVLISLIGVGVRPMLPLAVLGRAVSGPPKREAYSCRGIVALPAPFAFGTGGTSSASGPIGVALVLVLSVSVFLFPCFFNAFDHSYSADRGSATSKKAPPLQSLLYVNGT